MKKISHQFLKSKLIELWQPNEPLILIDLGYNYFIVKFIKGENSNKALHGGPWFILGSFLSMRLWEPNFAPQSSTISHSAIWACLPHLSMEIYDKTVLERIGRKLGGLLKIDAYTSATLRGHYARTCIQVSLNIPVKKSVKIENHRQKIVYEGKGTLCTGCGCLGHTSKTCKIQLSKIVPPQPAVL